MVKLDVPYRSQWAADAATHAADCGPTSLAMLLNYRGVNMTPDRVYDHIPTVKKSEDYTTFSELLQVAKDKNVPLTYRAYADQDEAFRNLRANLDAGNPVMALVKYKPWRETLGNAFDFGHFVVVTGYDDENVYLHDPLFGLWQTPAEKGAHYKMPNDLFAAGWGSASLDGNPNWAAAVAGDVIDVGPAPLPIPQPVPVPTPPPSEPPPTPTPTPTPIPPIPVPSAPTMDDLNRRIRALAAYRWAAPPDFTNPSAVQLWLDNLGDFGLEYDEYVVRSGDSLSGLASRYYGEQHRWPAIKAYNELQRDGLWVGETIRVPRLGTSGAHRNPALPHDTLSGLESLDPDMMIDPYQESLDYNALVGPSSMGIGEVDPSDG